MLSGGSWTLTYLPTRAAHTFTVQTPKELRDALAQEVFEEPEEDSISTLASAPRIAIRVMTSPLFSTREAFAQAVEAGKSEIQHGPWHLKFNAAVNPNPGGSVANRRRLMILADTAARTRDGTTAAEALIELPKVAAGILESIAGQPVMAFMAIGEADVQALREFVLSRQGLAGLQRQVEANP